MNLHVLPGDAYIDAFMGTGIEGEIAVFRECLVEGDVSGKTLDEFFQKRSAYLLKTYPQETSRPYQTHVAAEIQKIDDAAEGDSVYLWFEYELFCSANYWFALDLLASKDAAVFRIAPVILAKENRWSGFGRMDADDLSMCFESRVRLAEADLAHGKRLWSAFRDADAERLRELGKFKSPAFQHLEEVTAAAAEIDTRPREILESILRSGLSGFDEVFERFSQEAGVFGFGDLQVKALIRSINNER